MRFTVQWMMIVVALSGIVLGLSVEIPRIWRRWLFCHERAELYSECAVNSRRGWQQAIDHRKRTEKIFRTLKDLGPDRRSIASLTEPSDDLRRDRWCFKILVQFAKQAEAGQEPEHGWGETMVSPAAAAEWLPGFYEESRNAVRRRADWTEAYVQMARVYRRAAARPWEPLPHETIKP
jgi:hypothetical protein